MARYECIHQYLSFTGPTLATALKNLCRFIENEKEIPSDNNVIECTHDIEAFDDEEWMVSLSWKFKPGKFDGDEV